MKSDNRGKPEDSDRPPLPMYVERYDDSDSAFFVFYGPLSQGEYKKIRPLMGENHRKMAKLSIQDFSIFPG